MSAYLSSSTHILPWKGDRVRIDGLKGAKVHNGKFGKVKEVSSHDERRYKVELEGEPQNLSVRLTNLSICSKDLAHPNGESNLSPLHILIPCHISSDRRIVTFMRSAKSVATQFDDCMQSNTNFSVFIGLSGPENYRSQAFRYLSELAQRTSCRWYLQDDQIDARPQMEHLRTLLLNGSIPVNPNALLAFLDNDDMCHPLRFQLMMDAYKNIPSYLSEGLYTLAIPCKLLLHSSMTPSEGQLENFVNKKSIQDFEFWKRNSFAREKIQLATNSTAVDFDCEEYFDFIVPSDILKKFFELNSTSVTSNKYCDLRLYQILYELMPLNLGDSVPGMWLLAHYKIPMDEMRAAFDRHGERDTDNLVQSVDQSSFLEEETTPADMALAAQFPNLSPGQIAMCRGHLESVILSFVGWNDRKLEQARVEKTIEISRSHGAGFAKVLWEECHSAMTALFDPAELEASKGAWKQKVPGGFDDYY